jgi:hypothetical protein
MAVGHLEKLEMGESDVRARPMQFQAELPRSRSDRGVAVVRVGLAVVGASLLAVCFWAGMGSGVGVGREGSLVESEAYDLSQLSDIPGSSRDIYYR